MYSLDINFLNDRVERPTDVATGPRAPQDSPRPLYLGVAVGVFLPALAVGLWFFLQQRNASMAERQAVLNTKLATLQAQLQEVETINAQIQQIQGESKALATVFDRIKPWSAILQDIRDRVPTGIQVGLIQQEDPEPQAVTPPPSPAASPSPGAAPPAPVAPPEPEPSLISISGQARNFNDVNDFMLVLQRSPFLEHDKTRLVSAELIDNPTEIRFENERERAGIEVTLPKVVKFTIQSSLTNLPASELLQELERTLTVGLPARIEALRDRGVIQP